MERFKQIHTWHFNPIRYVHAVVCYDPTWLEFGVVFMVDVESPAVTFELLFGPLELEVGLWRGWDE